MFLPTIAITMGDPTGIGPEVIVKAATSPEITGICQPLLLGDRNIIQSTAQKLKLKTKIAEESIKSFSHLNFQDLRPGELNNDIARATVKYIKEATRLALQGEVQAMVTGPINKRCLRLAGEPYPGHTEFLARLTDTEEFAMMLVGEGLRVTLITTHCPLRMVAESISSKEISSKIRLTQLWLQRYFGIERPNIGVAALNPHAGEGEMFGEEEKDIISPAVKIARDEGIEVEGPLPADSLFHFALQGRYNAIICMYHDQGLIPLKMLYFHQGVNITLGLPIIRTSPDHGTGYDIAGKGIANPGSMIAAIKLAARMAKASLRA